MNGYNRHGGLTIVPTTGFEELANQLGDLLRQKDETVDIAKPKYGHRASGEPFLQLSKSHIGGHDVVVLTSGPGTERMLIELLFTLRYIAARRASRAAVITTYFPLGRSDRDEGELELALPPLIVDLMKTAAGGILDRVISFNLHCPQIVMAGNTGLITEVLFARRLLTQAVLDARKQTDKICIYFPDAGSEKAFEPAVNRVSEELGINLPRVSGIKRRKDSRTQTLQGMYGDTEALAGATVIGIDDEGATFGTSITGAMNLKRQFGVSVFWALVVHPVLCEQGPARLSGDAIDRTYCSDTIPTHNRPVLAPLIETGRLVVMSTATDLANIIKFHHWDTSIREMR